LQDPEDGVRKLSHLSALVGIDSTLKVKLVPGVKPSVDITAGTPVDIAVVLAVGKVVLSETLLP
jgi:hypothetical protein